MTPEPSTETRELFFEAPVSRDFLDNNLSISQFVPVLKYVDTWSLFTLGRDKLVGHATLKLEKFKSLQIILKAEMGKSIRTVPLPPNPSF